jgi:hypothetical protein
MPAATLVYNATPTKLGSLEVDCTVSEQYQLDNDVTENPVEESSSFTDHIRPKQDVVTIEGIISGTPSGQDGETRQVEYTAPSGEKFVFAVSVSEEVANGAITRIDAAVNTLYQLRNNGEVITLVTGVRTYENMAIKSVLLRRDQNTGIALRFTATLVQVQTVVLQTTTLKASKVSATIAKPHVKDGKKATKQGPEATALKRTGIALGDAAAKLFGGAQ